MSKMLRARRASSQPLAFLIFNLAVGPITVLALFAAAMGASPQELTALMVSPLALTALAVNFYVPLAIYSLAFSVAVWPSIARTGNISLLSGLAGCVASSVIGQYFTIMYYGDYNSALLSWNFAQTAAAMTFPVAIFAGLLEIAARALGILSGRAT